MKLSGTVNPDMSTITGLLLPRVPVMRCSCLHLAESARKSAIMACGLLLVEVCDIAQRCSLQKLDSGRP